MAMCAANQWQHFISLHLIGYWFVVFEGGKPKPQFGAYCIIVRIIYTRGINQ